MTKSEDLAETFTRLSRPLYRYAFSRLGSKHDAEEVVQDVFLSVLKGSPKSLQDSYWFQSVHNRCVDFLRHQAHLSRTQIDWVTVLEIPSSQVENWRAIEQSMKSLPEAQRDVLVMRYLCKMTLNEISFVQQTTVNTVASRQRYALAHLRNHLKLDSPDGVRSSCKT